MTDMTNRPGSMYVAPDEAPPPRRPPLSEVGIIHWLRENLFRNVTDSILTVITGVVLLLFIYNFLSWALLEAQWEVVFLNLKQTGVGLAFPSEQVWRAELAGLIVIFLTLLSVGIWGRINRNIAAIIAILLALMYIIPVMTEPVPEPPIHTYIDSDYEIRQINFIADAGQEITFTIEPLTNVTDFDIANLSGYIENNNQQANTSFDSFTEASTEINFLQTRNPEEYDLSVGVQVLNANREVVFESTLTEGSREPQSFTWEAPADGWYTYTMTRDDAASTAGAAWLVVENVEVFRSTRPATEAREAKYGPPPEFTCENCGSNLNRTDTRFEGRRTVAQWFSLQLTPFILGLRDFFLQAVLVGIAGYFLGKLVIWVNSPAEETLESIERFALQMAAVWFIGYIGVMLAGALNPQPILVQIRLVIVAAFCLTFLIYAIVQFFRPGKASRGVSILWLLSIPLILAILVGFENTASVDNAPLPVIGTENFGGLLLTLLLSAVAIIISFPFGIMLALGRQSELPVVSLLSTLFIEVIRGVPLITLLFMGRLILPFFGFGLGDVDLVIRIAVVLTVFTSAYMAEVIRGGLQIIPRGQYEASYALGLNNFWTTVLIVMPQALRSVIPAMMGQAVSLFKDTSLVYIVGLFEVLGSMNQILGDSQTGYLSFPREGYLYIGAVYFVFSYIMADISRRIERTGAGAVRRDTI